MFHVITLCKEILQTRHLDRSGEISTIACLQAIVSPVKDLYKQYNIYITSMKIF